jgi:hypothetical protein
MNTLAQWRSIIEVNEHPGEGTSHCFKARCPVCGAEEESTYWNDGVMARKGAIAAVVAHLQNVHAEHIIPSADAPRAESRFTETHTGTRPSDDETQSLA